MRRQKGRNRGEFRWRGDPGKGWEKVEAKEERFCSQGGSPATTP